MASKINTPVSGWAEDGEIVLEVRTVIGRIPYSRNGVGSPVEEAFRQIGVYLNDQASEAHDAEVTFEFMGAHFSAHTWQ